jgi:CO/xanthine dehydrogenase Mo-binding subunit
LVTLSESWEVSTAFSRGNVAQGFAEADAVVERQYRSGFVHQSYMEPHASLVVPDALGKLTVYTMTQGQFGTRDGIAENLGLDPNDVKVVNMEVGGAFGSKWMLLEPLAGWMALRHQRPVKIGVDRSTEFTVSTPAGGAVIDVKIGGKRDGTLTAIQARLVYDSGCYSASPYNIGALLLGSYYQCEHLDIASYEVLTNKPGVGAYRAPGAPHATFAIEQAVDELAVTLGLDPVAFRLRNASAEGQPQAHGTPWPSIGIRQILETIQQHPIWRERGGKPNSGVGVAIGGWLGGIEPCAANLKVNSSGELTLTLGHADITGTNTTFAMLAAEAFGTTLDNVKVVIGDTDVAPYAGFAGGSKTTYTVGNAVLRAAQDARWQVLDIAASELEASPDDLELVDGKVRVKGSEREISIAEAAQLSQTFGGRYEPVYGIGKSAVTDRAPGFSGQIAEVSVDPETGEVRLERYATIQDVGRALNPAAVEGQMLGGTVQAIGFGLYESMVYDENGQLLSGSFMDYSLPKAHQLPSMEAIMLEIPAPAGPLGAKGIGEPPIVPGAAAIANAVAAATGKRVTEMPMTPERVIAVLNNGSGA